jgi:hypothetical protein
MGRKVGEFNQEKLDEYHLEELRYSAAYRRIDGKTLEEF